MSMQASGDAAAIIEEMQKHHKLEIFKLGNLGAEGEPDALVTLVPAPRQFELHDITAKIDARLPRPRRRTGYAKLETLDSFVGHANRFRGPTSALFAQHDPPRLVSVLNYHGQGAAGAPEHCDHQGSYEFPFSDEWMAWREAEGRVFPQEEFALFLEERLLDLMDPKAGGKTAEQFAKDLDVKFANSAEVLALSRGLAVRVEQRVATAVNLASGEGQLSWTEEHKDTAGQPLRVPAAFMIAIPVFLGGDAWKIPVRLRYRIKSGAVLWSFKLHNAKKAFDTAFEEACQKAASDTSLPLYFGSPE